MEGNGKKLHDGSSKETLPFDKALEQYVGPIGRYQLFLAILLCLVSVPTCLSSMMLMFSTGRMDHWCAVPQPEGGPLANLSHQEWLNLTVPQEFDKDEGVWKRDSCHAYDIDLNSTVVGLVPGNQSKVACSAYEYDRSTFHSTIISKWDLVCDRRYLVSLTQSIGLAGMSFGGILGGISDRVGRWKAIVFSLGAAPVFTISAIYSPHVIFFTIMTFCIFMTESVAYITAFTFVVELVGPKWRAIISAITPEIYGASLMVLALVGYMLRDWTDLYWTLSLSYLLLVPIACFVPESPRWLYAKKRDKEGLKVLNTIARRNGRPTPFDVNITVEEKQQKGQLREFFSSRTLVFRSIIIFFAWMVAAFTYYGLTFSMDSLAGDIYVNLVISGALEVVGCVAGQLAVSTCLGRRITTCLLYLLTGLSLLLILAVPKDMPLIATALATFGRFCSTGYYTTIYIWTAELYPTVVRNTGISMSSAVGKIGGIIAPFVSHLAVVSPVLPSVVFGSASLLAGLLMLLLPETRGRLLPQTVTEMKHINGLRKPSKLPTDDTHEKFLQNISEKKLAV